MVIHRCSVCGKITINRIAGDDHEETILSLLQKNVPMDIKRMLEASGIDLLKLSDAPDIHIQLFGTLAG